MMANLKKRLCAAAMLVVLSLITFIVLLPNNQVSTHIQKITLGTTIDQYADLWRWGDDDEAAEGDEESGGGVRLIVFGDSWVDGKLENGAEGKGRSWPDVFCEQINCTSRLNFAASQLSDAWPASPPTGAMTANKIHDYAIRRTHHLAAEESVLTLPDLATQIQTFIELPAPKEQPSETIFVVSLGFWDVYDAARLELAMGKNVTYASVAELFKQLDILYGHFASKLHPMVYPEPEDIIDETATSNKTLVKPTFKVVVPRLFDPTLLPGWLSHRPTPLAPSSVAEQHKTAVFLTDSWNQAIENKMGSWMNEIPSPSPPPATATATAPATSTPQAQTTTSASQEDNTRADVRTTTDSKSFSQSEASKHESRGEFVPDLSLVIEKDIFYYDIPKILLDIIVEHQLEDEGLTDAAGLGAGESPFESVYLPCVREADSFAQDTEGMQDLNGLLVCRDPDEYLWWDAWTLGGVAKSMIGEQVGKMVREGKSLRKAWEGKRIHS